MNDIDAIDRSILNNLQKNGRLTNSKLAAQLNLSETPCWRRLKKLEEEGYIEDYQANLNRRKMGFGVMAFVQISCLKHDSESTSELERIVQNSNNVLSCHNTTGDADFLMIVVAKDLDDYSHFIDTVLRRLPGVSRISSNLSLRELKSSSRLPL